MARPRKSEQRDRKVQPPRPPNAWILYRSHQAKSIRQTRRGLSQACISKLIAHMWRNETNEVKQFYEQEAEERKAKHHELYPDYRFRPQRREPSQKNKKSTTPKFTPPSDEEEDMDDSNDDSPSPSVPAHLPMPYVPRPQQTRPRSAPTYPPNIAMPQPLTTPLFPESLYGPRGISSPVSATSSSAPQGSPESPLPPLSATSSSSGSSAQSSRTPDSQVSSSLQLPPLYPQSLPAFHHTSPDVYATLPLSTFLFQNSPFGDVVSPRLQLRSTENTLSPTAPDWYNFYQYLNHDTAANQPLNCQSFAELQQGVSPGSSFESLQAILSNSYESGVFNLSNVASSALLSHPPGDLEIAMGPQPSAVDYCGNSFTEFDVSELQQQFASLEDGSSSSPLPASYPIPENLQSVFETCNDPEFQGYTPPQQRQPSVFTQDMMRFLNFESVEGAAEDATFVATATLAPVPNTSLALPQVPQDVTAMPIFAHMTNTPIATGSSYVGAIHSSTGRENWKPSFANPHSQMDGRVPSWNF